IEWQDPYDYLWGPILDDGWADVIWGGGPTTFDNLIADDYLEPLDSALMVAAGARVPDTYAGVELKRNNTAGDNMWISAATSGFGFTVNDYFCDLYDLPNATVTANWTDLASYELAEYLPVLPTVAVSDAYRSSSVRRAYEIITQGYGWDEGWSYLARIVGNAMMPGGSSAVKEAVEQGAVGYGVTIDFYGFQSTNTNPNVKYISPGDYTIVNGDPIAISATSTQKDLAEVFVDYILSAEGQAHWLNPECLRVPVIAAAFDEPGVDTFWGPFLENVYTETAAAVIASGFEFNDTLSAATSYSYRAYFQAVFTDAQTELVACWNAIATARANGWIDDAELETFSDAMAAMLTADNFNATIGFTGGLFDIAKATELNNALHYDEDVLNHFQTEWTANAIAQYAAILATVPIAPP
ncbi:MAG: ABC transporter substrate-binding protein, partial [Candidatus Thorarchaeota archaeon]|nr:ABC transporter substrate-binding protein [Candidatus Thorarchaeota archaeon]